MISSAPRIVRKSIRLFSYPFEHVIQNVQFYGVEYVKSDANMLNFNFFRILIAFQ